MHRGSGSDAHLSLVPVGFTHLHTRPPSVLAVGMQRCFCTRHIMADFSSHRHSCQALTRPPQGHLPACQWLSDPSDPYSASPSILPTTANLLFHFGSTEAQMGAVPSAITVCSTGDFYTIPGCIFGTFVVLLSLMLLQLKILLSIL